MSLREKRGRSCPNAVVSVAGILRKFNRKREKRVTKFQKIDLSVSDEWSSVVCGIGFRCASVAENSQEDSTGDPGVGIDRKFPGCPTGKCVAVAIGHLTSSCLNRLLLGLMPLIAACACLLIMAALRLYA